MFSASFVVFRRNLTEGSRTKMNNRGITSKIDERMASVIKGMVARGDRQMDVAVWAGVNQARVNEIVRGTRGGRRFAHVRPAPPDDLPERGPYVIVARASYDRSLVAQGIVNELEVLLNRYRSQVN